MDEKLQAVIQLVGSNNYGTQRRRKHQIVVFLPFPVQKMYSK